MFRRCVVATLWFIVASAGVAGAQPRCVPLSEGVPGTTLWQHAPNWWNPALGFPLYDTRQDAPSWVRAAAHSHPFGGNGSVEDMQFRILHRSDAGVEYLYLSWISKTVPDLNVLGNNLVWFGFQGVGGGTTGVAIKIQLDATSDQTDELLAAPNHTNPAYQTQIRTYDGANWGPYVPGGGAAATPRWINGTTTPATDGTARVWIDTTLHRWGVNIRVPMSATATQTNLDSGINLGSQFKIWYELRISTPNVTNGFVPYKWPVGVLDMDLLTDSPTNPAGTPGPNPPASPAWETLKLSNAGTFDPPDATCAGDGVTFTRDDIGSDYPFDSTGISLTNTNTFHANVHNNGATTANGIKARFRIANWGTNPSWEDVPNPMSTLWQDIANSNGVPQPNGISITAANMGSVTTAFTVNNTCDKCMYGVYYNANKATCDATCGGNNPATNNTRLDHQCLLVDLTGAGVFFVNTSAYQNMNYHAASSFSQVAEINIKDLPSLAGGKDVYLYLQALNMPATAPPGTQGIGKLPIPGWPPPTGGLPQGGGQTDNPPPPPPQDQPGNVARAVVTRPPPPPAIAQTRADQLIGAMSTAVAAGQIDSEQLALNMPTLIVRAYYDTGLKNTAGGGNRPILKPLTSFGYFVVHDGEIGGWNYDLQGAQKLAPNWYKVAVPASGIAMVTTVVESLPPVRPVNWLLILLILVILLLLLVIYLWKQAHP